MEIVRDPAFTNQGNADQEGPFHRKKGKLNAFFESLRKLASWETQIRRPPAKISFVKEYGGWKIDSIPFRWGAKFYQTQTIGYLFNDAYPYSPILASMAILFVLWLICLWLYSRKLFVRI